MPTGRCTVPKGTVFLPETKKLTSRIPLHAPQAQRRKLPPRLRISIKDQTDTTPPQRSMLGSVKMQYFTTGLPRVARQIPCGEFMNTKVSDHLGRPWPGSVTFDGNQLVTSLPCGVTAAAGTHLSKTKYLFAGWLGTLTLWKLTCSCWARLIFFFPGFHLLWM